MAYGIEFRRADGSVVLEQDETFARLVHIETVAHNFSGTFVVSGFDSDKGMFYVQTEFSPLINRYTGDPVIARPIIGATILPSLSWENTAKTMTVSPPVIPSGWPHDYAKPNYQIVFIHNR